LNAKFFQSPASAIAIDALGRRDTLHGMNTTSPENPAERSRLWTIFWLTLVGTPAVSWILASLSPKNIKADNAVLAAGVGWVAAIVGAIICGGVLGRLTSKTGKIGDSKAVAFTLLFLLLFGVGAFLGCSVICFQGL
jgi:hypothetical protein